VPIPAVSSIAVKLYWLPWIVLKISFDNPQDMTTVKTAAGGFVVVFLPGTLRLSTKKVLSIVKTMACLARCYTYGQLGRPDQSLMPRLLLNPKRATAALNTVGN
jgi:hypothetical protein